ncbi:MAG: phosphopyruvate hydratase, partial [Pseudomonadales bacterium]|nr:phosphopyruvate hydratase [Pseudomonadales bacterium]
LPVVSTSIADAVRVGADVFHTLRLILKQNGLSTGGGDEGGFAPEVGSNEHAIEIVLEAITQAGYRPGLDVYLGLDVASSEFFRDGRYCLEGDGQTYTSEEFVQLIMNWIERYPILTIEDAMAEDDWEGWELITRVVGDRIQLTGDDLFVTNPKILKKGIDRKIANSVLIKVNQIGTLSETFEAICMAKAADYGVTISHRSGETEDTTIADLAVATGAGQIKAGSLCRSERVSKYNRLMMIEEELGSTASFAGLKGFPHYKKGGPTSKPPTSSG